jgi:hypothetical protein
MAEHHVLGLMDSFSRASGKGRQPLLIFFELFFLKKNMAEHHVLGLMDSVS